MQPLIWHIDNTAAAGGDGSAAHPFNSIAAFNTANAAAGTHPDTVYLHFGSGTYSEADGVNLNNGQSLIGQGSALTYQTSASATGGAHTVTLIAADPAHTPTIQVTGASGQGVTLAQNNTLQGFHIDTSTNAGAIGIEDDNLGGGTTSAGTVGTLNVSNVDITGAGKAIDIDQGGTLNVSLNSITSTGSNSEGIQLGGVSGATIGGSFAVTGNTSVTNATGNAIQVLNTTAGAGFNFGNTTVNDTVVGGHTGNGINLLTGIGTTNSFSFSNLADTTDGGFGLAASGGTINIGGTASTINANGGAAVDLTNSSLGSGATFATVSSTNSTGTGIQITGLSTGNFTANAGTISNATGTDVSITGGTSNITYNGSISDDLGQLVSVASKTGGTVAFGGAITDLNNGTGNGISLTNNTGATINFTGGMTLSTGANNAFTATGGGTVNATGSNHLTTTTGTALTVTNTTIGSSNLIFHDISAGTAATGPTNAIVLNTTGTSGGLHVTGDATTARDGSGGTIQHTTGDGVSLTSTQSVQLAHMNINSTGGQGVMGLGVNGFVSDWNSFSANGNATKEGALRFGSETDPSATGLTGGAIGSPTETRIDNTLISGSFERGVSIFNNSGTLTQLNVHNTTIQNSSTGSGMLLELRDSAVASADLQNSTFTGNKAAGFQGVGTDTSTLTVNAIGAGGHANTFSNNNDGVLIGSTGSAHVTTEISNNTFSGNTPGVAITVSTFQSSTNQGSLSAKILSNTITIPATGLNDAIQSLNSGTGTVQHVKIDGNNITNNGTGNGIFVATPDNGSSPNYTAIVTNNIINQAFVATAGSGAGNGIEGTAFRGTGVFKVEGNTVNFTNINGNSGNDLDGIFLVQSNNGSTTSGTASLERGGSASNTASVVLAANNPNAHASPGGPATFVSGTFTVVNNGTITLPLNAAPGGVAAATPEQAASTGDYHLTQAALDAVVAAAISQWAAAGASASQLAAMHATDFSVADLAGSTIGQESSPANITIDTDAAGHGWFVDPTPNDNSEFTHAQNAEGTDLLTDPANAAAGHLDLLTTVTHELGHVIGLDDTTNPSDSHGLMFIDLVDGERRLPDATDVAQANSTSVAEAIEAALPQSAQAAAGTTVVVGTAANDTIDAGHGGNILFGGAGADHFVFGSSTPLNAPTPAQITHVADYSAAEGDTFDFSAITSAFHNSSVNDSLVVRAVEDASGKFATLQVDHIDPMGLPSAPNWVNVAQLDGAHSGDAVNILVDNNHSVHLAQIHVDLLV